MTRVEAPGAELDGALPDGTGSPAGEGSLDVTGSPGGAGTPGGAAPQRGAGTLGLSPPAAVGLPERLTAVARLVQIGSARSGSDGFSPELLHDAEELVARAGQRLRLSSEHTIVVLAGGTGSGKSSLFNRLAGADCSAAGASTSHATDSAMAKPSCSMSARVRP